MSFGLLSTLTPTSTSTPEPTLTSTATNTPRIPTVTRTRQPSQTVAAVDITEWNGLPIYEGAYNIQVEDGNLSFYCDGVAEEIEDFYLYQLELTGWIPFATGTSASGPSLYMYLKGGQMITFSVIPWEGTLWVMFVIS